MDGNGNAGAVEALGVLARERGRAEAAELRAMLRFREAELTRTAAIESPMARLVERAAISLEIGQAVGLSEAQVAARLAAADRLRSGVPQTWNAFMLGTIDWAHAREVAGAVALLELPESLERLDDTVVAYASTHTVAELRAWLKRFVARVEAEQAAARAEAARRHRDVTITHVDDSMAWINAFVPSHLAAAISARLSRVPAPEGDDRTRGQRRTDAFVDLLLAADDPSPARTRTDIAVVIDGPVLAGAEPGPAVADDGTWTVPAEWIIDHLDASQTFWHRLLVDPITKDTLAHEYVGRFAPETLAAAIAFRDAVCQTPGCMRPAHDCDIDHRVPHPRGPTTGENTWALHRRHHRLKGQRTVRWILPSGRTIDAEPATHGLPHGDTASIERALARAVAQL